jgi:uncharacterized protein
MQCKSCVVCKIVGLLVIIGALNWGLVGILDLNLVDKLLGSGTVISRVVYSLVGVARCVPVRRVKARRSS